MSQIYLDLNRINSKSKNNNETNTWDIDLKQVLDLPSGTEIAIQNSFINQKGVEGASIEIERDYTETISCNVYTTEDFHMIPDQTPYKQRAGPTLYLASFGIFNDGGLFSGGFPADYINNIEPNAHAVMGGSGVPMILYEVINDGGTFFGSPVLVDRHFTIKKGVYGINQIADLITKQITGFIKLDRFNNYVDTTPVAEQTKGGIYTGNISEQGGLLTILTNDNGGVYPANNQPANAAGNYTKIFIPLKEHHTNFTADPKAKIQINMADYIAQGRAYGVYFNNQRAQFPAHVEDAEDYKNVTDYKLGDIGYTIGAPSFNISYDSDRNGFTLNSLHQPFRPPTHDFMANPISNAGSECIMIKNIARNPELFSPTNGGGTQLLRRQTYSTLLRPVTRIGGSSIHNFGKATSLKLGDVPNISIEANARFQDYFSNDAKSKEAWRETLWYKLGFTYEQLNDDEHKEQFQSYNNPVVNMIGITTDAKYDPSILQSISSQVNPNECEPTYSTGKAVAIRGIQVFNEVDIGTPQSKLASNYPAPNADIIYLSRINMYEGSIYAGKATAINVTTTSRPIIARNLPTLSIYGYYLITGSIVPDQNDIVKEGDNLPLLGVVPKSSLSNQDFFSTNNEITHTLSSDLKISNIKITILNPDLTPPELEENSSVLLRITKPLPLTNK